LPRPRGQTRRGLFWHLRLGVLHGLVPAIILGNYGRLFYVVQQRAAEAAVGAEAPASVVFQGLWLPVLIWYFIPTMVGIGGTAIASALLHYDRQSRTAFHIRAAIASTLVFVGTYFLAFLISFFGFWGPGHAVTILIFAFSLNTKVQAWSLLWVPISKFPGTQDAHSERSGRRRNQSQEPNE
jgi:hypothetical protein